ncbi:hypothetical protein FQA39_LY11412 [Lamprigera yunnana]|nr:hypothetical protein FQA39_LY11412 [Lamprigera yunnana]
MISNAYISYQMNTEGKIMTQLEFISDIIQSMTKEWMVEKRNPERSLAKYPEMQESRKLQQTVWRQRKIITSLEAAMMELKKKKIIEEEENVVLETFGNNKEIVERLFHKTLHIIIQCDLIFADAPHKFSNNAKLAGGKLFEKFIKLMAEHEVVDDIEYYLEDEKRWL